MASLERLLRPDKFDVDPGTSAADLKYQHWKETFTNYIAVENDSTKVTDNIKLKILLNNVSPNVYSYIRESKDYSTALSVLDKIYLKSKNEIHARYMLTSTKQRPDQTVSEFLRTLQHLAFDCDFKTVNAEQYRNEYIRDAFIAGIYSPKIRQRLLENLKISLEEAFNQAMSFEMAENNSKDFNTNHPTMELNQIEDANQAGNSNLAATPSRRHCFFCGGNVHQRIKCPAFHAICQNCDKKGHFAKVCRNADFKKTTNAVLESKIQQLGAISAASPASLSKTTVSITINNYKADALIDSGSSTSFIDNNFAHMLSLKRLPWKETVTLASKKRTSSVDGFCYATIQLNEHTYNRKPLYILDDLCADVIIGHDILNDHASLEVKFGGPKKPLKICNVMEASVYRS